jgi:3-oxoacyl-[acyl-carrier protein] reductase
MTEQRFFVSEAPDGDSLPREEEQAGRVWLVTGAGRRRGIGAAILREAVARGARRLAFTATERGIDEAIAVESELRDLGATPLLLTGNIARQAEAERWVDVVVDTFGRLDVLINNAGISGPLDAFVNMAPEQVREVFDVNLLGNLWVTQAAVRQMQLQDPQDGRIVFTGSMAYRGAVRRLPYGISKAALLGTAAGLAREYPEIRFFMLNPGLTHTDMMADYSQEQIASILRVTGQPDIDTPDRLARVFLDLVSPNSTAVSGATYRYDGERLN